MTSSRPGNLAANVVAFARALRRRGLPVGPREATDALRAISAVDVVDRREFYLALRGVLADSRERFEAFDEAFREFWTVWPEELSGPGEPEQDRTSGEFPPPPDTGEGLPALEEWLEEEGQNSEEREMPAYSPAEILSRRDFSSLSDEELDAITALVLQIARRIATRVSRRMRTARHSPLLDLRRTMRHSLRRGGEIVELLRRRRKIQKSEVLLLCDVSGSMDLYSRFIVQFIFALQHAVSRVETFVFSTSLTRITDALSPADIRQAMERVSRSVPNWSGGTKIGHSLRQFLDEHGRFLSGRTVVIIISDGWDTGEVPVLEDAMRELQKRSARLIWLNPLLGSAGYEPLCQGMRAALPHVDLFAPAHNLESLRRLERHLVLP